MPGGRIECNVADRREPVLMSVAPHRTSRRVFLATAAGLAAASAASAASYMRFVEAGWFETGRPAVPTGKGAGRRALKVLHLSDLHASPAVSLAFIAQAVELGLSLKPDLICLTGDYITHRYEDWEGYARVLGRLASAAPVFASAGNHDGGRWALKNKGYTTLAQVAELMARARVDWLHNRAAGVRVGGWTVNVAGLGDLYAGELSPGLAFRGWAPAPEDLTLVLSHNPDTKPFLKAYPWDVMLCGHTHGGQLALPLVGAPFAPVRDRRFIKGLHRWEERWIYVTKGVGNLYGMRLNCRPEVTLLSIS